MLGELHMAVRERDLKPDLAMSRCLRQSDRFGTAFDSDGNTIVYEFTRPERAVRVSESTRILIACFPANRFVSEAEAVCSYLRQRRIRKTRRVTVRAHAAVETLVKIGILIADQARQSLYTTEMAPFYARSRPVPTEVAQTILQVADIRGDTTVLDVGTGTGSLALQLGTVSRKVRGMDLCPPFLDLARHLARLQGVPVAFDRSCGNRLVFEKERYEVITVSQAFHWLDPVWGTRGLNSSLVPGGSLFMVETKSVLSREHPYRSMFGFGTDDYHSLRQECSDHRDMYTHLFGALPGSQFTLSLNQIWLFRQTRQFDIDFGRAYFFPEQLSAAMPDEQDPWDHLQQLLCNKTLEQLTGQMCWLVLHFRKTGRHSAITSSIPIPDPCTEIPYVVGCNDYTANLTPTAHLEMSPCRSSETL